MMQPTFSTVINHPICVAKPLKPSFSAKVTSFSFLSPDAATLPLSIRFGKMPGLPYSTRTSRCNRSQVAKKSLSQLL